MCYYIADKVGVKYTSDIDFVSLYINGEYLGLYNVASKLDYALDADGGLIAVFEKAGLTRNFDGISDFGYYYVNRYGDKGVVSKAVNVFETALYSDTVSYRDLDSFANINSIARKFFVDAVCLNNDVHLSQYYMVDKDYRISAICAWDFDRSFGVGLTFPYNRIVSANPWYDTLFTFKEFRQELSTLLQENFDVLEYATNDYLDEICESINNDWIMNRVRWQNYPPLLKRLTSNSYNLNTLQGHVSFIRSLEEKRLRFLNDYWNDPDHFFKITFKSSSSSIDLYYSKNDTITVDDFPEGLVLNLPDGKEVWCTEDGVTTSDIGPINCDVAFVEKNIIRKPLSEYFKENIILVLAVFLFTIFTLFVAIRAYTKIKSNG